ncbi:MAG TPA: molybdopterin-guanine dinucleotide biosynthesis protein B [bacterium]|nr:molybdopterin-guanine dinucleotide biosynthesis protein B [bacterium]
MIPTICVVANKSNAGKTTLVEKLIAALTGEGYKVGSIKFTSHVFDPDTEGKDTWKHTRAGAYATALATPGKTALFVPRENAADIDELVYEYFTLADIVIGEGGKEQNCPKIKILTDEDTLPEPDDGDVLFYVCDRKIESDRDVFRRDDIEGMVGFLKDKYFQYVSRSEVRVWMDGKFLAIKPFVKAFIGQTIKGMLRSLKGGKNAEKIHIKIGR